jgi:gluconokinase
VLHIRHGKYLLSGGIQCAPNLPSLTQGVSGAGKSSLAAALSKKTVLPYIDADDLHPSANVAKMARGDELADADREPWLTTVRSTAERIVSEQNRNNAGKRGVVIACSALKKYCRDILRGVTPPPSPGVFPQSQQLIPTFFVYIKGSKEVIAGRLEKRTGHFMKVGMLDSQLKTLESPEGEEGVIVVSLENTIEEQVKAVLLALKMSGPRLRDSVGR